MTTGWKKVERRFGRVAGVDPYVEWALGPGRTHYFLPDPQSHWIPILLQLQGITPSQFAEGQGLNVDNWHTMVLVADSFLDAPELDGFCTALVTESFFRELKTNRAVSKRVAQIRLSLPLDKESLPPPKNS
jgi:hypothetical protein